MSNTGDRRRASQLSLFSDGVEPSEPDQPAAPSTSPSSSEGAIEPVVSAVDPTDAASRAFAVDPRNHVVLEASAGTGKTSVLVARYLNLLKAGVDPANILAITFTRKASAEMRERIVRELRESAARSEFDKARWVELRDRLGEIAISTIDAFCLSLLREFPLEADLDPGFEMADETEVPRLIEESLDRSLRIITSLAKDDPDMALVLAQLGVNRTREGLSMLLERRLVAWDALDRFLTTGPAGLTSALVCRRAETAIQDALRTVPGGLERFLADGPTGHPRYTLLVREIQRLRQDDQTPDAAVRAALERVAAHFLTGEGKPRAGGAIHPYRGEHYPTPDASRRHRSAVSQIAPQIERIMYAFSRDLNVVLARGIRRMFGIALQQYRRALEERSVLDFSDVLQRALDLLRQMDEFAQSRYRLESRYHHVLVDEFQDTSRAQWELISLLTQSWGEGLGLAADASIFIVGDRKQSIYRFRDAEATVLQRAGRFIEALRPSGSPRRSITRSFRAVPELLEFVNDVFTEMSQPAGTADAFTYGEGDSFPVDPSANRLRGPALGISVADDPEACAAAVASEIARILREDTVRDRKTGVPRSAAPGDIAILFRSRASHREFERELERLRIPAYVYKGLGFFDADETKDVVALLRYLARPDSDLRAAAFLRSRFIRISDRGLALLAPDLARALTSPDPASTFAELDDEDRRVLVRARDQVASWLAKVDRVPPADLIEQILIDSAYAYELRGPRRQQAWENLKKMRGLIRRIQNRGYATLPRIADHLDSLTAGDESNAVLEALDAVNLMTVHAAKGLEFPIVFVVNLSKGASGPPRPVRVVADGDDEPSVSIGPFVSDADEADRERERHETRRLLYVAFTRARDRLYLSSPLKDGAMVPGRGSLGEVFPESIKTLFAGAASAFPEWETVAWSGPSGRTYEWRLCRPPIDAPAQPLDKATRSMPVRDFLGPALAADSLTRLSVTQRLAPGAATHSSSVELIVGRLVHRLFQYPDIVKAGASARQEITAAIGLLSDEERAAVTDADAAVARAISAWRAIRARKDVSEWLSNGRPHYEVPFSVVDPSGARGILRGTIDCLIQRPDGSVLVVEIKTGASREIHQRQLDVYVAAARALFPGATVEGRLVYS
ncbi:MAG TPA: UvrD-helicase domain-containing protein [Vicinamibacterales bacterium]|nr:UvrD-helicase domain-containing protein [Vicinamibacterales bacterium]